MNDRLIILLCAVVSVISAYSVPFKNIAFTQNIDVDSIEKLNNTVASTNGTLVFKSNDTQASAVD